MNDIQAVIGCSIELKKFFNIDLFVQGFYQIRVSYKVNAESPYTVKPTVSSQFSNPEGAYTNTPFPPCILSSPTPTGCSTTLRVVYRREEIYIGDLFTFEISMRVNANKIVDSFRNSKILLFVELWFMDKDYLPEKIDSMQLLCSRQFQVLFDPRFSFHAYVPVLFDYFHLCAVQVTINMCLLAIVPVCLCNYTGQSQGMLFSILFNTDLSQADSSQLTPAKLNRAFKIYRGICEILVLAFENLQENFQKFLNLVSAEENSNFVLEPVDCLEKLTRLLHTFELETDIHTIDSVAHQQITHCSAENILLWGKFIEKISFSDAVTSFLAREYHIKRVKRFAECFFYKEVPRKSALIQGLETQVKLFEVLRITEYFTHPFPLVVECTDLDGSCETIPVVFEELYSLEDNASRDICANDKTSSNISLNTFKTARSFETDLVVLGQRNENHLALSLNAKLFFGSKSNKFLIDSEQQAVKLVSYKKIPEISQQFSDHFYSDSNLMHKGKSLEKEKSCCSMPSLTEASERSYNLVRGSDKNVLDDSSEKSRALQQSFRGKSSTLERRSRTDAKYSRLRENSVKCKPVLPNFSVANSDSSASQSSSASSTQFKSNMKLHGHASTQSLPPSQFSSASFCGFSNGSGVSNVTRNGKVKSNTTVALSTDKYVDESNCTNQNKLKKICMGNEIQGFYAEKLLFFVTAKEKFKRQCQADLHFYDIYGDFSQIPSDLPYFSTSQIQPSLDSVHLIVCVHGLDGNCSDLRLFRTYIEIAYPYAKNEFLMSSWNQNSTFEDFDCMISNLYLEIVNYIEKFNFTPSRISFIGHSLGNIVIRGLVADARFKNFLPLLHTFLSLCGPHLGTLFSSNGIVNIGMWLMQKWKRSGSLLQIAFKDHTDFKQTFLYQLSKKPCFQYFRNVLLLASPQDHYAPFHSARIEFCKAALKDSIYGNLYVEMVSNLLSPILKNPRINFVRYTVFHNFSGAASNLIGRSAHIAVLDSEIFVEKLILISIGKYFL